MKLSFHGAAQTVTGSCHLLEACGRRILIDCGMFQGGHELEEDNEAPFGFDPASIDLVLLTHAHLDHCGRLPLLLKRGFAGRIIATAATRDLARLVLLDSARLHEEAARRWARHHHRGGHEVEVAPLYTEVDALDTLDRFDAGVAYGRPVALGEGLRATYFDAAHILGSASILVEAVEDGRARTILFSGDIGGSGRPLLGTPQPPPAADFLVMETTYGDRAHRPYAASVAEFYDAIRQTLDHGGNVVVPTFALERAQELLYALHRGVEEGQIKSGIQVFLDSPMAIAATAIFERYPKLYGPVLAAEFAHGEQPFRVPGLHFMQDAADSMTINRLVGGALIMAGSGMCTGGRVRHHLRHNLWREKAGVIFVGFAAKGTLARQIIDGAPTVRIFGETVAVRAKIHTINGFSGHADQAELLRWRSAVHGVSQVFLVHGEPGAMQGFAALLPPAGLHMPSLHQSFEL